ncbi:hypothetical protein [Neptunomonas sp. XY-337]|uniref:hypothetical protein n=1 Tax=Neptunomonas sp. XY-337 TaxID=2561897 RepID=UPI0010AAF89D|nr:hypothetical protein [Neptunomonas sp. XY-337]
MTQLPDNKKITVIFRIEAGCLGPQGASHVVDFSGVAQQKLAARFPDFIKWDVSPRDDKNLPELDYGIGARLLTRDQAQRYLAALDTPIDDLEQQVFDHLPQLIDQYFGR